MKQNHRFLLLVLMFIYTCVFSGCSSIEFDIEDTIKPPAIVSIAIKGTWKIEKYIAIGSESDESKLNLYLGKVAIFDNEVSAVGKDVCINPKYKIIRTSADKFIQNKYRIDESSLGLDGKSVGVVTVNADNQPFYELIVSDEKTAYVYFEKGFLVLNKISDTVDEKLKENSIKNAGINIENGQFTEDPLLRSGVLMGIRSADNTYRTLWICSKNREIKTVSYGTQLMVPRAKGFWEIGSIKNNTGGEIIYAEPYTDTALLEKPLAGIKRNVLSESSSSKILFVGNDYIGTECNFKLQVLPIDNISKGIGIALSDIINTDSSRTLKRSSQAYILSLDREKAKDIIDKPKEDNFTLQRRNGHWIMKSRLYYKDPIDNKNYEDFDLNIMVPSELVHYDEMNIPWSEIKSKIPWINDAYMSPNKDIVLLVSGDSIYIYPIKNKSIVNKQLLKIPLSKGDSIVMAEWCIGKYTDIWGDFVKRTFAND